jgi:putative membrane protein
MIASTTFPPAQRICAAVTIAAMIATPLYPLSSDERVVLTHFVIGGMFGLSVLVMRGSWGMKRAVSAATAVVIFTWLLEMVGSTSGFPFGEYDYQPLLRPQVAGVPLVVPFAWLAMAVPAREVARVFGLVGVGARVLVGALALTAWDVFLDPQMVTEGYWQWAADGWYRGIPLTNYLGWMAGGVVVMLILEVVLPHRSASVSATPVVHYAVVGVMETVAFAFFFDDRVVAVAGATAMLPLAMIALYRVVRVSRV